MGVGEFLRFETESTAGRAFGADRRRTFELLILPDPSNPAAAGKYINSCNKRRASASVSGSSREC